MLAVITLQLCRHLLMDLLAGIKQARQVNSRWLGEQIKLC